MTRLNRNETKQNEIQPLKNGFRFKKKSHAAYTQSTCGQFVLDQMEKIELTVADEWKKKICRRTKISCTTPE